MIPMKCLKVWLIPLFILLISCSMAMAADWDNTKTFIPNDGYGTIEVVNWLGLGATLAEYKLNQNTDICFEKCSAEGTATLYYKGSLFNNIEYNSMKVLPASITNAQVSLLQMKEADVSVPDYKEECGINKNGTYTCLNKIIGSHIIKQMQEVKVPYRFEELEPGKYKWKIEANKGYYDKVDWIGNALGQRFTEWAPWVPGELAYYNQPYYQLNNTVTDETGYQDWTNAAGGQISYTTGKIGNAVNVTGFQVAGVANVLKIPSTNGMFEYSTGNFEYDFWIKAQAGRVLNNKPIMTGYPNKWNIGFGSGSCPADDFFLGTGGSGAVCANVSTDIFNNSWRYIIVQRNSGNMEVYVDNVSINFTGSTIFANNVNLSTGQYVGIGTDDAVDGSMFEMDMLSFRNRTLNGIERSRLWNNGNGLAYPFTIPNTAPNTPKPLLDNYTIYSTQDLNCSFIATDFEADNMTAYFNLTINNVFAAQQHISNVPNGSMVSWLISKGNYSSANNVSCWAKLYGGTEFSTTNTTSTTIIQTVLTSQTAPANNYNTTNPLITFNCSAESLIGNLINISLWISGTLNYTASQTSSTGTMQNVITMPQGNGTWYCKGANTIDTNTTTTRLFSIDSILPLINVTNFSSLIITYTLPIETQVNWTVTDTNLDKSWLDNSTNVTGICTAGVCGLTIPISTAGTSTFRIYANDTYGNLNVTSFDIFVNLINYTVNYTSSVIEGEYAYFAFNLSANLITQSNATLNYNYTSYAMTNTFSNGTYSTFYVNVIAPLVASYSLVPFNFTYGLNGVGYNNGLYNQNVHNVPAPIVTLNCSPLVYRFSLYEETNLSSLNGTFKYNFRYGLSNTSILTSYGTLTNYHNMDVCFNFTLSPYWKIGHGEIEYISDAHVSRRYYLFSNTTITNSSLNNISLYDLDIASQTSFQLVLRDTSMVPYINDYAALVRWYPDLNQYKTVEMSKTDDKGATVVHVKTEDVDYRIALYTSSGTLIKLANPIRMVCLLTPCTYTLTISPGESDFVSFLNTEVTITYNTNSSIWTMTFSDASLTTTGMNFTVIKQDGVATYPICTNSTTASSGTLTCNTTGWTGHLIGTVSRSASPWQVILQKIIDVTNSPFTSSFVLWLSLLVGLPIVFWLSMMSPIAGLIGCVLIAAPALYFDAISSAVIASFAVMAFLIAHMIKRLNG